MKCNYDLKLMKNIFLFEFKNFINLILFNKKLCLYE